MGFTAVLKHKARPITVYRQNGVNFLVNEDPDSFAADFAKAHGPSACGFAIRFKKPSADVLATVLGGKVGRKGIGIFVDQEVHTALAIHGDRAALVLEHRREAHVLEQCMQLATARAGCGKLGKMILAGSSASAAVAQNYLSTAHMAQRLADSMKPIYDGFMPTSANGQIPVIDVPTILVPTMRETFAGNGTTQPDNEKLRVYEFAGMAHIDARVAGQYYPDPCKYPISRYPLGAEMAVALDKLFAWVDKGMAPPHADRFYIDFNPDNKPKLDRDKGSLLALDEFGNVKGGIRNTYVDVPVKSYHTPDEAADPRIPNPNHFIAERRTAGQDPDAQLCGLGNFETALSKDQLKKLYKNPKDYNNKVAQRFDELVKEGWALPVYREMVLAEAARVTF
jgi:hypothetical protein